MRRVLALLLTATTVLAWGCGRGEYDSRLEQTLETRKRQAVYDQYLNPPAGDKFSELGITLRPPKSLGGPQPFASAPEGQYDLQVTFPGPQDDPARALNLHVLARRTPAKQADAKEEPTPPAGRGPFVQDVTTLLGTIYAADAPQPRTEAVTKGRNEFRILISPSGNINAYIYETKPGSPSDAAALIWEGAGQKGAQEQIDATLETFSMNPGS